MATRRRIRMDKLKSQIAERVIGDDALIELEISKNEYVTIKLPILLEEGDDYQEQIQKARDDEESLALVLFGQDPNRSAEEQLAAWRAAGYTTRDLAIAYMAEMQDAQERLGKYRYNG